MFVRFEFFSNHPNGKNRSVFLGPRCDRKKTPWTSAVVSPVCHGADGGGRVLFAAPDHLGGAKQETKMRERRTYCLIRLVDNQSVIKIYNRRIRTLYNYVSFMLSRVSLNICMTFFL